MPPLDDLPATRLAAAGSGQWTSPPARGETRSTCCYCGVGCGVIIETSLGADGTPAISGVRGDPDHPANRGRLCSKGSTLALTASAAIASQVRAGEPELRRVRGAARAPVDWDEALDFASTRLLEIVRAHGPDAIAFYVSGQLLTEDYYIFNKFAKGLLGTNNIDTNSRLCMSSAVAGYKQSFGADAVPCCYEDLDHAATVFIAGANPAFAHPVLYQRLRSARQNNPAQKVIVVDPRRTDSAEEADLFLQIRPGADVWLFHGMLKVILQEGLADPGYIARHTVGFTALQDLLAGLSMDEICAACELPLAQIEEAARAFACGPTLSLWCQGLNQSAAGTDKNTALFNLHLATGQIGRAGAGPLSLTGQPNAMGGREVGGMANLLPAHRDLDNPLDRQEIARFWGVPGLPARPGKTAVEMFEAIRTGEIRAVWIVCTNPAHSLPDQRAVHEALARAELVIVQDAYRDTATAPYADLLLPATSWGEKEGTVTNSDRTISRVRAAQPGFGRARHDWQIALACAQRMETALRPGLATLFPYADPEDIWNEHRATTRGRDLDIGGLDYAILERAGPQQWPYPAGAHEGQRRLYEDGVFATADGRARFTAPAPRPPAEPADRRHPIALTSGRLRDQWHGMSRTGTLARSFAHAPSPVIELAPGDAHRLAVAPGELVHVTGRLGSQLLPAAIAPGLKPGCAFVAMHWSDAHVSGRARGGHVHGPNELFAGALDPLSKQPELKHTAVKVLKAHLAWHWHACAWIEPDRMLDIQQQLRAEFKRFSYAHCVPFGRERVGLEWRAADDYPAPPDVLERILTRLGLNQAQVLSYQDARRGQSRRVRVSDERITGFSVAGDARAAGWLRAYLEAGLPITFAKRRLLAPGATPPAETLAPSRILCNCAGVPEAVITAHVSKWLECPVTEGANEGPGPPEQTIMASLRGELRCGAQCGSCIPELRRLIRAARSQVPSEAGS